MFARAKSLGHKGSPPQQLSTRNPSFLGGYEEEVQSGTSVSSESSEEDPEQQLQILIESRFNEAQSSSIDVMLPQESTAEACSNESAVNPRASDASMNSLLVVSLRDLEENIQKRVSRRQSLKRTEQVGSFQSVALEEEEDTCLICMGTFNEAQRRNKRIVNPCINKCNNSPVHPRCIYQWQVQWQAKHGEKRHASCPLCRGCLEDIGYVPPDNLRVWTLNLREARKAFVVQPIPR
jgi:hypothetical protein